MVFPDVGLAEHRTGVPRDWPPDAFRTLLVCTSATRPESIMELEGGGVGWNRTDQWRAERPGGVCF